MHKHSYKSITSLALPLALLTACGDGSEGQSEALDNGTSEHISLRSVEISGLDSPHLLQPIQVRVSADVSAAAYDTNINVGMRTLDGGAGCVLGAMAINPAQGELAPDLGEDEGELGEWTSEAEFIVNGSCALLVGREDVELFVAFDPWHELDGGSYVQSLDASPVFDVFDAVMAAAVSVEGCVSCETTYVVEEAPGLDAQLRELNLSSVVAVLPVAGESGVEPVQTSTRADFSLTVVSRVTGLDKAQTLPDGLVRHVHRIRPLGSSDAGLPLVEVEGARHFDGGEIEVPGPSVVTTVASLHIEDAAREAIVDGVWSELSEFELVTCLETEFEQAVFAGEDAPRENDCAALPVVVARQEVDANGLPLPHEDPSAATSGSLDSYYNSWGGNAGYGFGYSGLDFDAWLEAKSTDSPTTTYGGIQVYGAGSWYEAGIRSEATVFGEGGLTIIDIYGTFIGYDFGGGGAAMGATVFNQDFIPPFEIQLADGVPLSLQDMFDAASLDVDPTYTISYPIAGVSFDDGCDDVGASISIDTSLGIDTQETTITASSTPQGVEIAGVFTPFFDVSVFASASTGSFLGASAGITASLTLLNISLPFTVAVEVIDFAPLDALRLEFNEYASAYFNTLSGRIDFVFKYKNWLNETITHDHNIAKWNGFDAPLDFFNLTQNINTGSEINTSWCEESNRHMFSGDFDGDGELDYLCKRETDGYKWVDFGPSFNGTDWHNGGGTCVDDEQLVVGDFNGDERDDILCRAENDIWVDYANNSGNFYGGADGDWLRTTGWCSGDERYIRAHDYNNDGRDDLLCYRPSDGYKWIDYADSNGEFYGTDWDGTSLPDVLPSFVSAGQVELQSNWVTVNLPQSFTNPVVIAGPASNNGGDPVVIRVRNVGSNSFQIKVQEWDYDDGGHSTWEQVAWMVIEAGVNVDTDGTVWEAGTFTADGDLEVKTTRSFTNNFSSTPYLFATAQTYNGTSAISTRVDNLGSSSFKVLLDEQEANDDGHSDETMGYLAISGQPSDTGSHSFYTGTVSVGEDWTAVDGISLMMQEETSLDSEVAHSNETVHVLGVHATYSGEALYFAQDVTYNGTDSAALRWQ